MKNLIILSGEACTGKTTVGRDLAAMLGYTFNSAGNHAREFARERYGMEIHMFQDLCATDRQIDRKLDEDFCQKIQAVLDGGGGVVADFRMGAHFFPSAMSVYLKASPEVVRQRLAGREGESFEELSARNDKSRQRLLETYGYDYVLESNYRHVIDTDLLSAKQIAQQVIGYLGP